MQILQTFRSKILLSKKVFKTVGIYLVRFFGGSIFWQWVDHLHMCLPVVYGEFDKKKLLINYCFNVFISNLGQSK